MAGDPLAFFTLDHGTASTAAALVAPVAGRFRLLAADAQPAGLPAEALLTRLVDRAVAHDEAALPDPASWRTWARLEVVTRPAPRVVLAGVDEAGLAAVSAAATGAGWRIAGRLRADRLDAVDATSASLASEVDLLVAAGPAQPSSHERGALADATALLRAACDRRPGVTALLAGGAAEAAEGWTGPRLVLGPAAAPAGPAEPTPLGELLAALAVEVAARAARAADPAQATAADGRRAFDVGVVSLAAILEQQVEGVDVGTAGGLRVAAGRHGREARLHLADGGLVPPALLDDDRLVDSVVGWSTLRDDAFLQRDRLRNLALWPWRDASGEGAHLRIAAARAALARLDAAWSSRPGPHAAGIGRGPELVVVSGGCFSLMPPGVAELVVLDTMRWPGGVAVAHDHARLLAPLGSIEDEGDRRRLLVDLLDDLLLPLGSVMVVPGSRAARHPGRVRIGGPGPGRDLPLVPGAVQVVPVAPGTTALVELDAREAGWLGPRARRVALEVGGGLGGLLIDTRDVPLHLPDRADRRRDLLEAWERPLWPTGR
ncbi:MAG TPA: hypothetical protein VEI48_00620 [Candidatus Sulfotelmatobacter sp.]|nr:hypothetical protein [Candidatus Sulfotelmatobacter sp.]